MCSAVRKQRDKLLHVYKLYSYAAFCQVGPHLHSIYWETFIVIADDFDTLETEKAESCFLRMLLTFCLSPVRWANSTISLPNWLKICTNSWKVLTLSRWSRVTRTWEEWRDQSAAVNGHIWFVFFSSSCRTNNLFLIGEYHIPCLSPQSESLPHNRTKNKSYWTSSDIYIYIYNITYV